ncbi:MAG: glycosyltransferase family 8 protein [Elusimicrobiota bacterium]|jgi:lipopolysaccharide biosynthesis glycosyltransferase|nr:glycosyltransferase family 8 protein [Elusimicrobiota bacterium]
MINVAFGFNDAYAKFCGVTVASILANHKILSPVDKLNFFFLGNISKENKEKMFELKKIQDCQMSFINMDDNLFKDLPMGTWDYSTCYRLLIPEVLPAGEKKVIYLDCDIILNRDIKEFWDINIDGYYLSALYGKLSPYDDNEMYFNAGVMLLNLQTLRDFNYKDKWRDFAKHNVNPDRFMFPDQDILNGIIKDKILPLDSKFNMLMSHFSDFKGQIEDIVVIHLGGFKPWQPTCKHPLKEMYFIYAAMVPWKIKRESYLVYSLKFFKKHPLFFLQAKYWKILKNLFFHKNN